MFGLPMKMLLKQKRFLPRDPVPRFWQEGKIEISPNRVKGPDGWKTIRSFCRITPTFDLFIAYFESTHGVSMVLRGHWI
jgi:hypothetical protein